ncbi:ATP-binding cassette domain-containing protein [uncultured Roseibium sp.]|uniref:type I secretion system permease/ATPase n=1 Tax=uncultured Roseibium sp. TaxID=1936171 RepID=UPI003216DA6B
MFDVPWLPFYLGIVFLFHPVLGLVALSGAIIISILIGVNEAMSRSPVAEANRQTSLRTSDVEISQRNSEVMHAMGMDDVLAARWAGRNDDYLTAQRRMADRSGFFGTLIKTIRFVLQSAMLATGAWLAIEQEITPGVMIASSIMTSRALSPIEQAVAQWRGFVACRQALRRLREGLANAMAAQPETELPLPAETLSVESVSCGPYGSTTPFVRGASFELQAGDGLGIIGPSGSGKSTLARALVGVLPTHLAGKSAMMAPRFPSGPRSGAGNSSAICPRTCQLFDGTVAENIARFRTESSSQQVIEAARLADVHDLIVSLPEGYDTLIGRSGYALSAGQSQRIALARALYGNPFVVVLDEPNSNLDAEGEAALTGAIKSAQQRGAIVVVIAHRPSALATLNKILCLRQGQTVAFGPKG